MNLPGWRLTVGMVGVVWLLCFSVGQAQDPQAFSRSSIGTTGDLWTGQKVTWVVELIVPGFFSGTPAYDLPDVPGLMILPPEGSPTVGSEQKEGISDTVQRLEFSAFAQRPGTFQIPPMTVRLAFKRKPLDPQPVVETVQTPAVSFTVKLPPGAEKLGHVLSAGVLKMTETWQPVPAKARIGDAFTRTIVFSATDIPAMAFPPFPVPAIEGLGIYRKVPQVLDQSDRGILQGKRQETITYVCEKAGTYTIPAYQMSWWNIGTQKLETIELPEQHIQVEGSGGGAGPGSKTEWRMGMVGGIIFLIAAVVCLCKLPIRLYIRRVLEPWKPIHLSPLNPGSGK